MNKYEVFTTKKAENDEAAIYHYIAATFGEIYARKFRDNLIEVFTILSKQPFIGRPAKKGQNLRVFLFSKQNKIVYKVSDTEIVILRLLNTNTNFSGRF
ncbi:type II toxin-antitoxin system RelE/ParE family toxin [Aridibaculum aurantiacum]|uniref:type II toxin-antitoxin system RelE/ParE family toxin n=1 Tax=Aridibaculum aurantiacum TaxID=2810307 RepID=UPI001A95C753